MGLLGVIMELDRVLNEMGAEPPQAEPSQNQVDIEDLNNPRLKNILTRIEQTKKRHAKELEGLMKQLEMVKAKNNKTKPANGNNVPGM